MPLEISWIYLESMWYSPWWRLKRKKSWIFSCFLVPKLWRYSLPWNCRRRNCPTGWIGSSSPSSPSTASCILCSLWALFPHVSMGFERGFEASKVVFLAQIHMCWSEGRFKERNDTYAMKEMGVGHNSLYSERKRDAPVSPCPLGRRWGSLAFSVSSSLVEVVASLLL